MHSSTHNVTCSFIIALALPCFAFLQLARATDLGGVLPGNNTADGTNVLISLTTGINNSGFGFEALKADTTGNYNTATGVRALWSNTMGVNNTADGAFALAFNNGYANTAVGYQALYSNNTGGGNTATGYQALYGDTSGGYNTAYGYAALSRITNAVQCTAVGAGALALNTVGFNTAVGDFALELNTTGPGNTAVGNQALTNNRTGGNNTAMGDFALARNQFGNGNTAVGWNALAFVDAIGNTAMGYNALLNNSTGSYNIALGQNAGSSLTTGNSNIDLGNSGMSGEALTTRIGYVQTRTFIAGIRNVATGNADATTVVIDSAGQLGTVSSSQRFKKHIRPMDKASEAILALRPVTFEYKSDTKGIPQFGLIAEEVAKVNPALVVRDANGEIHTVRYDAVNAMLLNEFLKAHRKQQQGEATIAELRSTIAEQRKWMEALAAQLKEQNAKIDKVSAEMQATRAAPELVENR